MANWCRNYLTFEGDTTKVVDFFKTLEKKEYAYIRDTVIVVNFVGDEEIEFESKWSHPNLTDIAVDCKATLKLWVVESGSGIYGKETFYKDGSVKSEFLKSKDFKEYQFNYKSDYYEFRGEEFECEEDILEILWDERYG